MTVHGEWLMESENYPNPKIKENFSSELVPVHFNVTHLWIYQIFLLVLVLLLEDNCHHIIFLDILGPYHLK